MGTEENHRHGTIKEMCVVLQKFLVAPNIINDSSSDHMSFGLTI